MFYKKKLRNLFIMINIDCQTPQISYPNLAHSGFIYPCFLSQAVPYQRDQHPDPIFIVQYKKFNYMHSVSQINQNIFP